MRRKGRLVTGERKECLKKRDGAKRAIDAFRLNEDDERARERKRVRSVFVCVSRQDNLVGERKNQRNRERERDILASMCYSMRT